MGKRGPAPKPTALKELEGNPGQRRLNKNEPKFDQPPASSEPPAHLTEVAQAEWARLFPVLRCCGMLTLADLPALAVYCALYARWVEAETVLADPEKGAKLLKTPNGSVQPNPWITISRQTAELMKAYLIEFGMTPAARARMGSSGDPPPAQNPGDAPQPAVGGKFAGLVGRLQ
ncbi:MAG: phage terminase small subunit P27 family [Hyphomonadaceae bacterium]